MSDRDTCGQCGGACNGQMWLRAGVYCCAACRADIDAVARPELTGDRPAFPPPPPAPMDGPDRGYRRRVCFRRDDAPFGVGLAAMMCDAEIAFARGIMETHIALASEVDRLAPIAFLPETADWFALWMIREMLSRVEED